MLNDGGGTLILSYTQLSEFQPFEVMRVTWGGDTGYFLTPSQSLIHVGEVFPPTTEDWEVSSNPTPGIYLSLNRFNLWHNNRMLHEPVRVSGIVPMQPAGMYSRDRCVTGVHGLDEILRRNTIWLHGIGCWHLWLGKNHPRNGIPCSRR